MSQASEAELLMLDLINEERTSRGLDPLEINNDLNATAEDHSQWMLDNDIFQHEGAGGSSSGDRIADDVANIHASLMNSPGHRQNILNPELEDIGIGIETGDFQGFDGVMITQNFGSTDAVTDGPDDESAPVVLSENEAPVMPEEPPVADEPEQAPMETAGETEDVTVTNTTSGVTTNSSSATVTAASGPDGADVEITGEGDFTAEGTATNGDETVTEADSGGSLTDITPDDDGSAPATDIATMLEGIFDMFDFGNMPMMDAGADDVNIATAFQGTIATDEGTFTTNDPAEFDMMFMDMFTNCFGENLDFG